MSSRRSLVAEVDRHGTSALTQHLSGRDRRFQVLVAGVLSAQTRDENVAAAMDNLRTEGFDTVGGRRRSMGR